MSIWTHFLGTEPKLRYSSRLRPSTLAYLSTVIQTVVAMAQRKSLLTRILEASTRGKLLSAVTDEDWAEYRREQRLHWIIRDVQWARLSKLSGIGDDGRKSVETALRIYRNTEGDRLGTAVLTAADTRKQLLKLAEDAHELHASIESMLDNDLAVRCISFPADKVWTNLQVWSLSDMLQSFSVMIADAASRCERGRPGPRNDNLWGLISTLADLWTEATGQPLSVSNKRVGPNGMANALEFITQAVQIADPNLKGKDDAIRDVIKALARTTRSGEN